MTPNEVINMLKDNRQTRTETWSLPIRLGEGDAIAAELIEIAMNRLGDEARMSQLLDVAASLSWWVQVLASLSDSDAA